VNLGTLDKEALAATNRRIVVWQSIGLGSYQQADSRLAKHDQGDPVDDSGGQPSRSDDEALHQPSDDEDGSNEVGSLSETDSETVPIKAQGTWVQDRWRVIP